MLIATSLGAHTNVGEATVDPEHARVILQIGHCEVSSMRESAISYLAQVQMSGLITSVMHTMPNG